MLVPPIALNLHNCRQAVQPLQSCGSIQATPFLPSGSGFHSMAGTADFQACLAAGASVLTVSVSPLRRCPPFDKDARTIGYDHGWLGNGHRFCNSSFSCSKVKGVNDPHMSDAKGAAQLCEINGRRRFVHQGPAVGRGILTTGHCGDAVVQDDYRGRRPVLGHLHQRFDAGCRNVESPITATTLRCSSRKTLTMPLALLIMAPCRRRCPWR